MSDPVPSQNILRYYREFDEHERLASPWGKVERLRTQRILERHLPPPPLTVLDVGGGTGPHAFWLAGRGYDVHLFDPVPELIQKAKEVASSCAVPGLKSIEVGDARRINFPTESADAVLIFGPLYHLQESSDREKALQEAYRVLRPGGFLFAATISRAASLLDGLFRGFVEDESFQGIISKDLETGIHKNTTGDLNFFTDAYFHRVSEVRSEVEAVGFKILSQVPVEGLAAFIPSLPEVLENEEQTKSLLDLLEKSESVEEICGATSHVLSVAIKS